MFTSNELSRAFSEYQEALQEAIRRNTEDAEDFARLAKTLEKLACFLLPACFGCIAYCLANM